MLADLPGLKAVFKPLAHWLSVETSLTTAQVLLRHSPASPQSNHTSSRITVCHGQTWLSRC